jgi:hypothetical protein
MHTCCVVPPNANRRSSEPKIEEQKAVRRARDRLNYAKKHPIQKRSRKDIINGKSMEILGILCIIYIKLYTFSHFILYRCCFVL